MQACHTALSLVDEEETLPINGVRPGLDEITYMQRGDA